MSFHSGTTELRHVAGPVYEWELPPLTDGDPHSTTDALRCTSADGQTLGVGAFADGDRWLARAALAPGEWRWSVRGDDATGTLVVPQSPPRSAASARWPGSPLRISANRRFLTTADGAPFFWLADTAWFICSKGTPDQWERYLDHRVSLGFTVVQVILLPLAWDLEDPDGNAPFVGDDLTHPNPAYFRRLDQFCAMAAERGLVVMWALIWGGDRPTLPAARFTTEQAVQFARYAVTRLGAFPAVWSLSGDAPYVADYERWETVGTAVEECDPYAHPTTNHLSPTANWFALFHHSEWHDFHMLQTGHRRAAAVDIRDLPQLYNRLSALKPALNGEPSSEPTPDAAGLPAPPKPVVNGEPWYEAHPATDVRGQYGPIFSPYDARYAFWVSVLSGATMGHTYGSQGIWNWKRPGDSEEHFAGPQIGPVWTAALDHDGARQCGLGAKLVQTLPWWQLQPAPERVQLEPSAARDIDRPVCAVVPGRLWIAYQPIGDRRLTLKGIEQSAWQARWFDPRAGAEQPAGPVEVEPNLKWTAPLPPTQDDWVLIVTSK